MTSAVWKVGDRVIHTGKPEWGPGAVVSARATEHDGEACQMLSIRFERVGLKNLSTAFAKLVAAPERPGLEVALPELSKPEPVAAGSRIGSFAGEPGRSSPRTTQAKDQAPEDNWLGAIAVDELRKRMLKLPEDVIDPFTSHETRLKATLALYKYTPTGGSLLDWAVAQSGLSDPLSKFNRHELEKIFEQFCMVRDQHLKKVVLEYRKADAAGVTKALAIAPATAQQALKRLDAFR
jgi:hypothetical protein